MSLPPSAAPSAELVEAIERSLRLAAAPDLTPAERAQLIAACLAAVRMLGALLDAAHTAAAASAPPAVPTGRAH